MKKTLTQDITRYDNKIRLRLDLRTFRIAVVSALVGLVVGILLNYVSSFIYAVGMGVAAALFLFALQLVEKDGIPLIRRIPLMLAPPAKRQYEHTANIPGERLTVENERKGVKK